MGDEFKVQVELPLGPEGFLRCACSACGREFKCLVDDEDDVAKPEGGYHCPYCARQGEDWLTEAQSEYLTAKAGGAFAEEFFAGLAGAGGSGAICFEPNTEGAEPPREVGDMERRDPACHPGQPIKVLDGWSGPVHCLICAEPLS
jgi:hypothetical protein